MGCLRFQKTIIWILWVVEDFHCWMTEAVELGRKSADVPMRQDGRVPPGSSTRPFILDFCTTTGMPPESDTTCSSFVCGPLPKGPGLVRELPSIHVRFANQDGLGRSPTQAVDRRGRVTA
jgi:hypothetical protein